MSKTFEIGWRQCLAAVVLAGALASCGGNSTTPPPPDGGTPDSGTPDSGTPDAGTPDAGTPDAGTSDAGTSDGGVAECDKPANVSKKAALVAAQPTFGYRSKAPVTKTTTFASVADDPSVNCPVDLNFKDLNGDGTLQTYEDWTRPIAARVADLVGRMSTDQKLGLMAHAVTADAPTTASGSCPSAPTASPNCVSVATQALITANIRFGTATANTSSVTPRATWANRVQETCEATGLGIPFVISTEPVHTAGNGRVKAKDFYQWPQELGLAATGLTSVAQRFGAIANKEFRALGIRMALSPSADLFTDPRWFNGQFTFGEDSAAVSAMVAAYVRGFQDGTALGPTSVAAVVRSFPGAGATKAGFDARLEEGKLLAYPGNNLDAHLAAFQGAFDNHVAGVMPAYGVLETGAWTALGGLLAGATIEQVGASFNVSVITDALRTHYSFNGLVLAPPGVLNDKGTSPLGAPWGMESADKAHRVAKAVGAGVDQFSGLNDTVALAAAKTAGLISDAQVNAAATRALTLMFQLGLFENPYVDVTQAAPTVVTGGGYLGGLDAMDRSMVLVVNGPKPSNWLNGSGDGTQSGDTGNAGNGSGHILPAPPGQVYVAAGCNFYIAGDFLLDFVRSVSAGYGNLLNDATSIAIPSGDPAHPTIVPLNSDADRMSWADYVLIRVAAPCSPDAASGPLNYCATSLQYAGADNSAELAPLATARAAINGRAGSQTQIVVGVDGGRPSVVSEILSYGVTGLFLEWGVTDKVFLDVAFGIVDTSGRLPVGIPLSDAAAATQKGDLAGDGQHATFVKGYGFSTKAF